MFARASDAFVLDFTEALRVKSIKVPTLALTLDQKRQVSEELSQCLRATPGKCRELALARLQWIAQSYPDAIVRIPQEGKRTLLYLHSYSLSPSSEQDDRNFLKHVLQTSADVNLIALPLTGHEWDGTPQEMHLIQYTDWFLDAELAFKLSFALGDPVTVKGNSLGGLLALHLAQKYPNQIHSLILVAPAVMTTFDLDGFACLAQNPLIAQAASDLDRWAASSKILLIRSAAQDPVYLQKYLQGLCPLSKTMFAVRSLYSGFPLSLVNSDWGRHLRILKLGLALKIKTLLLYSENDEGVDVPALDDLARALESGSLESKIIQFPKSWRIGHLQSFQNLQTPDDSKIKTFDVMDQFIRN